MLAGDLLIAKLDELIAATRDAQPERHAQGTLGTS